MVERELHKLQDKYREAISNEYELTNAKEHLEISLKLS